MMTHRRLSPTAHRDDPAHDFDRSELEVFANSPEYARICSRPADAVEYLMPPWVSVPGWFFRAWTTPSEWRQAFVVESTRSDGRVLHTVLLLVPDGSPALQTIYEHVLRDAIESACSE